MSQAEFFALVVGDRIRHDDEMGIVIEIRGKAVIIKWDDGKVSRAVDLDARDLLASPQPTAGLP